MPYDRWASPPDIRPHGYGWSVPVAVAARGSGTEDDPRCWDGIRLEVRSLVSIDIELAVAADPDATAEHLPEALARALDAVSPTIQNQIDELTDLILGGD